MAYPGTLNNALHGQLSSAFTDTPANVVRPPENMAIIAIHFLGNTTLDSLVAKDAGLTANSVSSSNSTGSFTRKVNQTGGSSDQIIFDDTNAASGVAIGDEVYDATGALFGTVTALDPDSDNANEIQISSAANVVDDATLSFITPGRRTAQGVGGETIANTVSFPGGSTIYGRWDAVSINGTATNAGIICYFGD